MISRQRAWGVPIAVFVRENRRRLGRDPAGRGGQQAHRRRLRGRRRGRLVRGRARASASSAASPTRPWQKVDDILDVWFDSGSTHAFVLEDPRHFPSLAGIKRKIHGGPRYRDVSGRLRPASRLVPFLAARKLRHARRRAVRRGADARLRARRARAQDVEVARQHGRAAGRDEAVRRRHPAPVGRARRTMPTTSASARRSSRPRSIPTASCATPSAGCSATWRISAPRIASRSERMPELERLMLHRLAELDARGAPGLRRVRLQAHLRGAEPVHDGRSLGVLFRHPQGRALLRSLSRR